MSRYIDAEKLKNHFSWWKGGTDTMTLDEALENFNTIIDLQPTHDNLEEVVYCKDCKYLGVKDFAYGYCKYKMTGIIYPDYFCCYGELDKKKNEG